MSKSPVQAFEPIHDVLTVPLTAYSDDRGRFMETFRKEWFPQVSWDKMQSNRSDSKAGVLRGLHYHFKQIDYWYAIQGTIRAGLVDLRPSSPTYLQSATIDMGIETNNIGLFIPVGVAHGFAALTDCTLIYIVNNYYSGADEFGVAWNDPQINLDWGVDHPVLSDRDQKNPLIEHIPTGAQPV